MGCFRNRKVFLILLVFVIQGFGSQAESQVKDTGIPFITHHSKKEYQAGTQNWDFIQDDNGNLLVANNQGVLMYDGQDWSLIPMPNRSVVRCLFKDDSGRIYVGAYTEFGFLAPDSTGSLAYQSLLQNIPDHEFGDIWKITSLGDYLYFQSFDGLIIHNRNADTWRIEESEGIFGFLHQAGDQLFMNHRGYGLMEVRDGRLSEVPGGEIFADWEIWAVTKIQEGLLIGTQNNGVYIQDDIGFRPWDVPVNNLLLENRLFSFEQSEENLFWGTIRSGLIVTDNKGEVVTRLNKDTGLNNNTVLSLFIDTENNLWLGLDNGIDQILIHSQLSNLQTENDIGAGYCSAVFNNRIYLGTNQGLFWIPYGDSIASKEQIPLARSIPECSGQVWALKVIGDELLVGHNRGTFVLKGDRLRHIYDEYGGWNFNVLPGVDDYVLQGTYNGLVFYQQGREGLEFAFKVKGFELSSRLVNVVRDRTIWVGHGYEGVFRLVLGEDLKEIKEIKSYGENSGLGTDNFNELLAYTKNVIVSNPRGIFIYNEESDDFRPAVHWNKAFIEGGRLTSLIPAGDDDYYYFQENSSGHLQIFADTLFIKDQEILSPLYQSFIASFEDVNQLSSDEILFGTDNGFVHMDLNIRREVKQPMPFHFKEFASLRNQGKGSIHLVFKENLSEKSPGHPLISIPYRDNDIRISFVSPYLTDPENIEYQYLLDGRSVNWSPWSRLSEVDFINLREGDYLLRVKARSISGSATEENQLFFHINTPWYRSVIAYISYFLIVIGSIYAAGRYINSRLEREKRRAKLIEERRMVHQQIKLKRDSEMAEKEIVKLRNDKLRADIRHKSKELANQTMGILQKNRFLTEIKDEMVRLKKRALSEEVISSMRKMIKKIDRSIEDEDTQKVFEINFDQVHENFLQRLREAYPNLTAKDLRLCAYLRLNLSSKEIAPLLNISIRGVEISRYRLRKKLELDHNESLANFILRF